MSCVAASDRALGGATNQQIKRDDDQDKVGRSSQCVGGGVEVGWCREHLSAEIMTSWCPWGRGGSFCGVLGAEVA